jgi:hypothetical protein
MWHTDYHSRLADWADLRQQCNTLSLPDQALLINNWWWQAPMVNQCVRWNEVEFWPNPWELLTNSGYCDLARALGIVYTFIMLDNTLYTDLKISQTDQDNLVLINSGEYILNWSPSELLNIDSSAINISKSINSDALSSFLN